MARIYYGLAGEGRGHAARARAVVERLTANGHEIVLFAPRDAYGFLAPLYPEHDGSERRISVERAPGLHFRYDRRGRIAYGRTAAAALGYVRTLRGLVARLTQRMRDPAQRPDLVLSDFEGALPRAARRAGVPHISVDHQHFLEFADLSELPRTLRAHASYMRWIVRAVSGPQDAWVVSSFYAPPLRPRYRSDPRIQQIGVLLRPEFDAVRAAGVRHGEHLCCYLRRECPESVLRALGGLGIPVHVFGLGGRPSDGDLHFAPVDEAGFVRSLASCRALVCTAGNQLVGEAMWLGKPVFAMPEPGNYEQAINAHFVVASGAGASAPLARVGPTDLHAFVERVEELRAAIDPSRLDGTGDAIAAIERQLRALGGPRPTPPLANPLEASSNALAEPTAP